MKYIPLLYFSSSVSFSRAKIVWILVKFVLLLDVYYWCISVNSAIHHVSFFCLCFSFSQLNVASYLQVICLAENFRTDVKDFVTLLTANTCDIRKSILYLQFWIRSGGGFLEERPLSLCRKLICYKRNFYSGTLC